MAGPIKPGRVRLVDIAKEAGVNRTAVGKVLLGSGSNIRVAEETAERIREVARRMNYRPNQAARQLKGASTNLLGLFMPYRPNQASQMLLYAVEREAHQRGVRCLVGQMLPDTNEVQEYMDDFEARGVECAVCLGTADEQSLKVLRQTDRVIYTVMPPIRNPYCVELDRAISSKLAVDHLWERGYRRIGQVLSRLGARTVDQRLTGWNNALKSHGVEDPESYLWVAQPAPVPFEQADDAIEALVVKKGCDALFGGDDRWAVRLIKALRQRGLRVPEDVAVVGHNNQDIATAVDPELTTVDPSHTDTAMAILAMMQRLRDGETIPAKDRHVAIAPTLIVRGSS